MGLGLEVLEPGGGFGFGDEALLGGAGGGLAEVEEALGGFEVLDEEDAGGDGELGEAGVEEVGLEVAADLAIGEGVAPGGEEQAGDAGVGGGDGEGVPVVVVGEEESAGQEDAGEFANGGLGLGEVLEDAVDTGAGEGGVGEWEVEEVGGLEIDGEVLGAWVGAGLLDEFGAGVEAGDGAGLPHPLGHAEGVVAEAAAGVEDAVAGG